MFDDKKEPQDIFERVDANSPRPAPIMPTVAPTPEPASRPALTNAPLGRSGGGGHVVKTVAIVAVAFLAIGASVFFAYRALNPNGMESILSNDGDVEGEEDEIVPDGKGEPVEEEDEDEQEMMDNTPMPNDSAAGIDSDGDGLSNAEELEFGTSVSKPDTDSDGLGDKEELQVYGTDPRRNDTDGDTFFDGQEVRSGYNPNGPGRILEVPPSE